MNTGAKMDKMKTQLDRKLLEKWNTSERDRAELRAHGVAMCPTRGLISRPGSRRSVDENLAWADAVEAGRDPYAQSGAELQAYKLQDVADRLKITVRTVKTLIKRGEIKAMRIGNRWRVSHRELCRVLGYGERGK